MSLFAAIFKLFIVLICFGDPEINYQVLSYGP